MTADEIKVWRARMGLSIRGAARALGLSPSGYQAYEEGVSRRANPAERRTVKIPHPVELACKWLEHEAQQKKSG